MKLTCFLLIGLFFEVVYAVYIPPGPRYVCPNKKQFIYPCECVQNGDAGIYVRCENSNLAAISVGLNNLATFKLQLEELILHKCNIERMYGSLLYNLKVRVLKIEDTPIQSIDHHLFLGVNKTLQELHILNSKLNEFPKGAFKILGNLTVLNIDKHEITQLSKDIFFESYANHKLEKLHFTNGKLSYLPVESFQTLRKLKTLDLHGNLLSALQRNQFKGLRDVEVLDVSHNQIMKLESSHIADLTKLSWCNISHNAITELSRGTFARNAVLRVLNMSNNKIKRLDTNSFRGMRFLRRLYLSDNLISDIGRGSFGSITRIGTIDLARNKIEKIDYQMFHQLNYVEIIDVSENNVTEIQKLAFKDLYLTKINISYNAISKIENGAFENCANITLLDLSHNEITEFPRNTFDVTTYATELQLSYNMLTSMGQIPLHNMTGLKVLNVSNNLLTTIPKNSFPKLYELHTIDLAYNNISEISNAVFQTLFSLRVLNLSYNSLEQLKNPTFGTMPTLLELDLSNNMLKAIAKGSLTKCQSLRFLSVENNFLEDIFTLPISLGHLKFANNNVTEIPEKNWPSMNALLSLDLSKNKIQNNLKFGSFSNLLTLQRLNLSENGLSRVPWESLSELTALQYLYLQGNELTELPRAAFGRLPVVFELNMSNNKLFNISSRSFEGLLQLLTLNMSSNAIRQIPNGAFQGLVSLRILDLSNNFLEKLDNKTHGLLDDCLSLEKIDLSHNKITYITRKSFPSNPYIPYRLKEIDLSYNAIPILTYDITFGTKKVEILNISHNNINDIRRGVLGNLTSLQTLDLSYNDLSDLTTEADIFNFPDNFTSLLMENNRISAIPLDKIENATNLKFINLRNNQLTAFSGKLVPLIKDGLDIYYEGNPLQCDCFIRPLKHYLLAQTVVNPCYHNIICNTPLYVSGQALVNVTDDHLNCIDNVNTEELLSLHKDTQEDSFDIQPDIKFREIFYAKDKFHLQWFVTSNKDIADFFVTVRDQENNIYLEKVVGYSTRELDININNELKLLNAMKNDLVLEMCVLAKDSLANVRSWLKVQCKMLPRDLYYIKEKFNNDNGNIYTIYSSDKKNNHGRNPTTRSNAVKMYFNISLIYWFYINFILLVLY